MKTRTGFDRYEYRAYKESLAKKCIFISFAFAAPCLVYAFVNKSWVAAVASLLFSGLVYFAFRALKRRARRRIT